MLLWGESGVCGGVQHGLRLLEMLREDGLSPDATTWNGLMRACTAAGAWARGGAASAAERGAWVLEQMRAAGVRPDVATYATLVDS